MRAGRVPCPRGVVKTPAGSFPLPRSPAQSSGHTGFLFPPQPLPPLLCPVSACASRGPRPPPLVGDRGSAGAGAAVRARPLPSLSSPHAWLLLLFLSLPAPHPQLHPFSRCATSFSPHLLQPPGLDRPRGKASAMDPDPSTPLTYSRFAVRRSSKDHSAAGPGRQVPVGLRLLLRSAACAPLPGTPRPRHSTPQALPCVPRLGWPPGPVN